MTESKSATESFVSSAGVLIATLRVGVFFDGTGNNRINSQIGADCQAMAEIYHNAHIKECGGRHSDPNSSYSNDLTNVARLADLYRHNLTASNDGSGLKAYASCYVGGVGTTSGGRDFIVSGQGFGRGITGVRAKVCKSIKKISDVIDAFRTQNPGCVIGALELDIFGFSRGGAAARHLANEVLKQDRGSLGAVLARRKCPLAQDFSWNNGSVRLKVIGLFDTVAAVGGIADMGNTRDALNHKVNLFLPPGCAQQVLHLVAADEHRRNFVLNSVLPGWSREIVVPGAHSDIGGGYGPQMIEKVALTRPRRCLVTNNTPYDTTQAWIESHDEMTRLDAQRWIDPADETANMGVECEERPGPPSHGMKTVTAAVMLKRRVFGHLSRVYLRVMHALARDEGVPFMAIPDCPTLSLPPELSGIAAKLLDCARGKGNGLNEKEMQMLYRRYIHCSAHWNPVLGRQGTLVGSVFLHAPEQGGRLCLLNECQPGYPK